MVNLVTNLLIFANVFLVEKYGLETGSSMYVDAGDETKNKEYRMKSEGNRRGFIGKIKESFKSLESAYTDMDSGRLTSEILKLKGRNVLFQVPSVHHLIETKETSRFVIEMRETDVCYYEFRSSEPAGWELMSGVPTKDRFAHDRTTRRD